MKKSIWESTRIDAKTKKSNIETDILIIGGGITGITSSLLLSKTNHKITLIEANKIGGNTTKKTTGKLSIIQGYNYQEIEKNTNKKTTLKYLDSQIYAIDLIKKIIKKYKINCDLNINSNYLFTKEQKNIKKIIKEKEIINNKIKCDTINKLPNKYPCLYGIKTNNSYTFNPLKYIKSIYNLLKDKIDYYDNTKALEIIKKLDYYLIKTNKNKIKAKKVIICTNYPIFTKNLLIPLKTTIEKEYVLAAKTNKVYNSNMLCNDDELISIRYYKDKEKYIIYSSNKSNLCNNLNHKQNINELIKKFKNHFTFEITNTWYNYDIKSNDNLPIIGKIKEENIFIATAFNKWGMTNSILSAKIISDLIKNKPNEYTNLFNPYRKTNINKIKNSCLFAYNNIKAYTKAHKKQKNIKYKFENGIEYAIYIDENNKEHKVINKCPHLKCKLIFNEFDKTWDCPCHGSRYNVDGKVIKGPSNYSITPKK